MKKLIASMMVLLGSLSFANAATHSCTCVKCASCTECVCAVCCDDCGECN